MIRYEDTKLLKLFVGGLPYETDDQTLREYFEQFGEIREAVVIKDRDTQKSKGYGFVTFHDKESAEKACVNRRPVIDGRTANVNLAYIGAKVKPTKGSGKNVMTSYGYGYKQNTVIGSQQFPCNFSTGFSQPITAQPLQTVSLLTPQSPNGHIPASGGIPPTAHAPVQLIEYNGVPTIVFGTTMYDQIYYSPASYVPSPTLSPPSSVATSFTYQTVAPQSPPFNSLNGQQFFPTHVEIIGQPQL